ncbi:HPr family phosphocarrier protein [Paenibacillus sp. HJGM_3]|uniref:HPr family phosphocarrier protein n=1 Tax=Paenibacillus sp. HJGM_3 TaxID=3379816 RepID=UPI00385E2FA1
MRVHDVVVKNDLDIQKLKMISTEAGRYKSQVYAYLNGNETQIDVKSLLGLLFQRIPKGATVSLRTIGTDDLEAMEAMCVLFEN